MSRFGEEESRFGCVEFEWCKTQLGNQTGASERGQGRCLMFGNSVHKVVMVDTDIER